MKLGAVPWRRMLASGTPSEAICRHAVTLCLWPECHPRESERLRVDRGMGGNPQEAQERGAMPRRTILLPWQACFHSKSASGHMPGLPDLQLALKELATLLQANRPGSPAAASLRRAPCKGRMALRR